MKDLLSLLHSTNIVSEWRKDVKGRDYLLVKMKHKYNSDNWPQSKDEIKSDYSYAGKGYGLILYFHDKSILINRISAHGYKCLGGKKLYNLSGKEREKRAKKLKEIPWRVRYKIENVFAVKPTKKGRLKVLQKSFNTYTNLNNELDKNNVFLNLNTVVRSYLHFSFSEKKEIIDTYEQYIVDKIRTEAKNRNLNLGEIL